MFNFFSKFFKKSGDIAGKSVSTVVDTAVSVGNVAGKAVETTGNIIYQGVEMLASSVINTTKFLADAKYRAEVGYPWLKGILRDNWKKVRQELGESNEMLLALWKYSKGHNLSEEEKKATKEQLGDIIKTVPALGIFLLPGGMILLPLLAKALPWDLMPSSFKEKVTEEYGEDALNQDLGNGDDVPIDEDAQISLDLHKEVEESMREILDSKEEAEEKRE
ncbi:LETM1 domain-containing protein [Candidatus Uabimicrobium sp. HlEnr_7]|uniref:LETM1 domain-containing protein n=1 Tax=Candidatus Uabimicrobium helgolandensis TaxID=3095367 RepID=UPI003555BF87